MMLNTLTISVYDGTAFHQCDHCLSESILRIGEILICDSCNHQWSIHREPRDGESIEYFQCFSCLNITASIKGNPPPDHCVACAVSLIKVIKHDKCGGYHRSESCLRNCEESR